MFKRLLILILLISTSGLLKSQDFLDWNEYKRLWSYVELTPKSIENNPVLIVDYLKKGVSNKRELIEIIYYWIANNISYDVEGYLNNDFGDVDGLSVLESRKSVCQGYAELFKLLCDNAKIECVIISGYAKGPSYSGLRIEKPNHSWNAVELDNQWKLIDVTWGSGYVEIIDDSLKFKKNLNLGYLFSKPDGFIIEHFPEDPKWQLLTTPISINEFYSKEMDDKIEYIYRFLR
jgi:transglutaminase/protease-like cytokinesis protein 3